MIFKKKRYFIGLISILIYLLLAFVLMAGCSPLRQFTPEKRAKQPEQPTPSESSEKPALPKQLGATENQEPNIRVFIKEENRVQEMKFEEYVAGVVGGEIKNDWPEEAIKAQTIIARTFVLHFINEKGHSKYENAHVSTDIEEAQAWNLEAVNERIRKAVADTRGQVMVYEGEFAQSWFHSNAAGMTATAKEGLNYKKENPPYIQPVKSPDDSKEIPPDEQNWELTVPKAKVLEAIRTMDSTIDSFSQISIGEKGASGRAINLLFDKKAVSAPDFRIAIGSTEMKSTLLDKVEAQGDQVVFKGRGYGHGVGMSQWGAYSMAKQGKTTQEIIEHYFKGVNIVKMWE